jgi:chromate reductase, NAD(P)H dehydrogenase (quinone)
MTNVRLLLVTGSTRRGSTNSAALDAARGLLPEGAEATLYEELGALPAFNRDDDHDPLPAAVAALRNEIAHADAVVFCTPEYAGTLPGAFKNLLDWTVGGVELSSKAATWINVAAPGRGTGTEETLAMVLGYVGATIMKSSGVRVPVARVRERLADAFAAIVAELNAMTEAGSTADD